MLYITIEMEIPVNFQSNVIQAIRAVLEPTLATPGCSSCALFSDVINSDRFVYFEEWKSRAAFENHVNSRHFDNVLSCIDLAKEKPKFRINKTIETDGLKMVNKIRGTE
ncbi:MAG: antibiotic biosynthesis monooxygenase [Desulfobacterales bacterium]|nr:antibiotic biosynthesis monooxygenase [Desulfobacterales bacterium]